MKYLEMKRNTFSIRLRSTWPVVLAALLMGMGPLRAAGYPGDPALRLVKPRDAQGRDLSGQDQVQTAGYHVAQPLRVRVEGLAGLPRAGEQVRFEVVSAPKRAGGWELTAEAVSDSLGMAQARFKVGDRAGIYIVSARLLEGQPGSDEQFFEIVGRASNWVVKMIMSLVGGLGMFLFGMRIMSDGLKKSAGNRMRFILQTLTRSRFRGLLAGAFVTTIIQSSSATTVMLVSFVEAGLMRFFQTLGVILGADIGTTITAQIIAFKLTDFALLLIGSGFAIRLLARKESLQFVGEAILGFGLVFNGMNLMSNAMAPLRSYPPFIDLLSSFENPIMGLLVGAAVTALIQSSSAFTGIVIVLGQQGLITLDAGIPLILGANIGTTITAGLACIGSGREAKRVALAHALFKVGGVVLFIFWIPAFADLVRSISPGAYEGASVFAARAATVPRQIANAHTIFNVGLAALFFPFTQYLGRYILRLIPDAPVPTGIKPMVVHLDTSLISTPDLALNMARAEVKDMVDLAQLMLGESIKPFLEPAEGRDTHYPQLSVLEGIQMREKKVDFLDGEVSAYLFEISRGGITNEQANEAYALMSISHDLEAIGDIIDKTIVPLAKKKLKLGEELSEDGREELRAYHTTDMKQLSRCREAIMEMDVEQARKIMAKGAEYLALKAELKRTHFERVRLGHEASVATDEIHVELMEDLKKINDHAANIANTILEGLESSGQG